MKHITLITPEQVKEDCAKIGIPNWYRLPDDKGLTITIKEAALIMDAMGITIANISVEVMRQGLQIELEHGCISPATNITNNHPIMTASIVMAHHNESVLYYPKLAVMEMELKLHNPIQDMYTAIKSYDMNGIRSAVEKFKKVDTEEESLSATEIAIAGLL